MPIDSDSFKSGMRQLASGVCLVTTRGADGARSGLTATAVCSVSADPPTLLVCVNQQNGSYRAIRESGSFAVNVLAVDDQDLSNRFASAVSGDERFKHGVWSTLNTGAPVLESALVSFDCILKSVEDVGSHGVFFGEVQAVRVPGRGDPLLYGNGQYATVAPIIPS